MLGGEHATFTPRLMPKSTASDGKPIKLKVNVEDLCLFDPDSGDAIR